MTSRSRIATTPCELRLRTWLPAMPAYTGVDLAVGHQLGLFDRALNRLHGRLDVDHHALLQAARGLRAHADDLDGALGGDLADQRQHLGGADVQSDDDVFVRLFLAIRCDASRPAWRRPSARGVPRPSSRPRSRCRSACPRRRCRRRASAPACAAASMKRSKRSSTCCRPRRTVTPSSSVKFQAPRASSVSDSEPQADFGQAALHRQIARRHLLLACRRGRRAAAAPAARSARRSGTARRAH